MNPDPDATTQQLATAADRFYGELLVILAAVSATAPFFAEATLAWTLLLAGLAGAWWVALDRTPRGLLAAAGWTLVAIGLGFHLAFHAFLGVVPLGLSLGGGFVLLGVAELSVGIWRYRRHTAARLALVVGGAAAVAFGVALPLAFPDIPSWAAAATIAVMFAAFGAALLIGSGAGRQRSRPEPVVD